MERYLPASHGLRGRVRRLVQSAARHAVRASTVGMRRGPHVTRYYMYRRLREVVGDRLADAATLSISHSTGLCGVIGIDAGRIREANYPAQTMLALPFADETFDCVVSDQVLEHIAGDPQLAIDETYRVLRPGGIAVHTSCLLNPIHDAPGDFWRFTPDGLRFLCRRFSTVVEAGGWGNPIVPLMLFLGLRHERMPEARWHPLHRIAMRNHRDWPIVTWVVAKK